MNSLQVNDQVQSVNCSSKLLQDQKVNRLFFDLFFTRELTHFSRTKIILNCFKLIVPRLASFMNYKLTNFVRENELVQNIDR